MIVIKIDESKNRDNIVWTVMLVIVKLILGTVLR